MLHEKSDSRAATGTQALDSALQLLLAMTAYREPVSLSELARFCSIQPSKAHRYLASFMNAGLVEQTGRSGRYFLGAAALRLGLAAMARHDFVNAAADGLQELSNDTALTALLTVWGNEGATVVRWERAASPVVTVMGLGSTLPLLNSASGRVFLTWAPQEPLKTIREAELRRLKKSPILVPDLDGSAKGIEELRLRTREAGYAHVDGKVIPGLVAIAAPVLDWQGYAQAAITLIGTNPDILHAGSPEVAALKAYCAQRSIQLNASRPASRDGRSATDP